MWVVPEKGPLNGCVCVCSCQCFFVTVRAGTAYRKIWRLVNNFFPRIIRFTVQKFQLFWVIFCIIIFFIELWHILILWLAKMPNGDMPVFTLIATGWRYRKIFFYKKALCKPYCTCDVVWQYRPISSVCLHGCSLTIRCSSLSFHTTRVTRYKYAEFCWRCPLLAVSVYKTVRCPYVCLSVCLSRRSISNSDTQLFCRSAAGGKHRSTAAGATGYRSISAPRTPSMLWSEEDRRSHVVLISTSCAILSMIFNLQDVYVICDHWHLKRYLSNVPSLKDWKDSSLKGSSSNAWCWIQRKLQQSYYRSFHCGSVLGIHVNCSIVVDSQLSSKQWGPVVQCVEYTSADTVTAIETIVLLCVL